MRIDNALRLSGSSRCITHGGWIFFRKLRIIRLAIRLRKKRFIGRTSFGSSGSAMAHYKHTIELNMRAEFLKHIEQNVVDDQKTILRMVDDISDLLRMQTKIQCMQDAAHGG